MKTKGTAMKSVAEYLNTPEKVRSLVGLFPKKNRAFVKAIIQSGADIKTNWPDHLAQYYHRLAHSVIELESAEAMKSKAAGKLDPVKCFSIGSQGSLEQNDRVLGLCVMKYFSYTQNSSGLFAGYLQLEPQQGGVTFTFLKGLPEGATVSFFLNWSWGYRKAVASPTSVAVPRQILSGCTPTEGPDFQWTIVRPNTNLMFCITDNNPEMGTIAGGVDCRVSYY